MRWSMGKWFVRVAIVLAVSTALSSTGFSCGEVVLSVLYTVLGIIFSITMSLQMSFSFVDVENDEYVKRFRGQISRLRAISIVLFSIATILFVFSSSPFHTSFGPVSLDMGITSSVFIAYCLLSFGFNFRVLSQTKEEIEDAIRRSRRDER